ncbi:MAG: threonine--tRNA ligase [Candidatus Pacebacteria bacterium]|nr:threonine--tRNA ligase [Candidatus Paceibacterota bacterium]
MSNSKPSSNQPLPEKKQHLQALRHTAEHVLTSAMQRLYGRDRVVMAMGPATEDGFYFDFDTPEDFVVNEEMFSKIEKEMKKLIAADLELEPVELSLAAARQVFADNPYKLEWLDLIEDEGQAAQLYLMGTPEQLAHDKELLNQEPDQIDSVKLQSFVDLCKGPHVKSTAQIKAFKLLSVAGAYWHGDETNKMLTRVYGTAFATQEELDQYLHQVEEAKKRDHRLLGQKLELLMFDQEVGQGLPLWLPKGAFVRHKIQEFAFDTYLERGYQPVTTPHIASSQLWQHSGHLDFYGESMYNPFGIEGQEYRLKPMNCPLHVKMYQHRPRSYRELPLRWAEMGTVYRYEKSGTLHGLTRVRGFTQDDAHIVCTPEQMQSELTEALKLTLYILRTFGFEQFEMNLSTRGQANPDKFIGSDKDWIQAEQGLKQALAEVGFEDYEVDEGGAAFYGPKIDVKLEDSLGRKWQLSTIQFDFNLPGRFGMSYVGADGEDHQPLMIHRALLGSLERFMGIYIEHTAGSFPLWLAPVQAKVLPITDEQLAYARKVVQKLEGEGLRAELDERSATLGAKIRDAEQEKVPYMLVIGGREAEADQVTVRYRDHDQQETMATGELIEQMQQEVEEKR